MARAGSEHVVPRGSTALAMRFVACAICLVAPAEASGPLSAVGFQVRPGVLHLIGNWRRGIRNHGMQHNTCPATLASNALCVPSRVVARDGGKSTASVERKSMWEIQRMHWAGKSKPNLATSDSSTLSFTPVVGQRLLLVSGRSSRVTS